MKAKSLLIAFLALATVFNTSCKKDGDNTQNTTSAAEIQKTILKGVWQLHQWQEDPEKTSLEDFTHYWAYKFKEGKEHEIHWSKDGEPQTHYYKITTMDGKAVYIYYSTEDNYNRDSPSHTYDASIENGKLKLVSRKYGQIEVYKQYNSISETRDLPPST